MIALRSSNIYVLFIFSPTILFIHSFVMFRGSFNAERLKVNLRLVINRLKLLEKKKSKFQFLEKCHLFVRLSGPQYAV